MLPCVKVKPSVNYSARCRVISKLPFKFPDALGFWSIQAVLHCTLWTYMFSEAYFFFWNVIKLLKLWCSQYISYCFEEAQSHRSNWNQEKSYHPEWKGKGSHTLAVFLTCMVLNRTTPMPLLRLVKLLTPEHNQDWMTLDEENAENYRYLI